MSYKDIQKLFDQERSIDVVKSDTAVSITEDLESLQYVDERNKDKNRYVPHVDYQKPENFSFYGSAEEYYEYSFEYIRRTYPYDGSLYEKQEWHNNASDLDNHIFENKYPRTTGYVNFYSYGSQTATVSGSGGGHTSGVVLGAPATQEYIFIKGGPNPAPDGDFKSIDSKANKFNQYQKRSTNLDIDFDRGMTVEFWYKGPESAWPAAASTTAMPVMFDLWNGVTGSNQSYGRFTIFCKNFFGGASGTGHAAFAINCVSGSRVAQGIRGFDISGSSFSPDRFAFTSLVTASVLDGNWHHYAFVTKNNANDLYCTLYVDGVKTQTISGSGQALGPITLSDGPRVSGMNATIGSSIAHPWIDVTFEPGTSASPNGRGWNKVTGSIDEFRFWKTARTSKQIGRNWFSQIGGGTNTDLSNVDLGIYYKFNEGNTGNDSQDVTILDYSGRISNASFVGYTGSSGNRSTGSALDEAGYSEFKDPIILKSHPSYIANKKELMNSGSLWDKQNPNSIHSYFPEWILSEDRDDGDLNLKRFAQTLASYLDEMTILIQKLPRLRDVEYISGSNKPMPFSSKKLESAGFSTFDLFRDAEKIERFLDRNEQENYEDKIHNVKNFIYNNVYNNLTSIFKSKGNEKSLKQLLHTMGIDEDIFKINLYASNITYELSDNYNYVSRKRKLLDFNREANNAGTLYQTSSYDSAYSYISGSPGPGTTGLITTPRTYEVNVLFPEQKSISIPPYKRFNEISSSIFGVHTQDKANSTNPTVMTWDTTDPANFQVYAVRERSDSKKAKFVMTTTDGGVFPSLESGYYDLYENEKWNLSVSIRPTEIEVADRVKLTGSTAHTADKNYTVEFRGFNTKAEIVEDFFLLSGTISTTLGVNALTSSARVYVGSHYTNFTGSVINKSDVKVANARVWLKYLSHKELVYHARDVENYGTIDAYRNHNLNNTALANEYLHNFDTLALNWEFSNLSTSDASGQFLVSDVTTGSSDRFSHKASLGDILYRRHDGLGANFPANSADIFDVNYIPVAKQRLPEVLNDIDMISILTEDDENFPSERALPIRYLLALEKSMYQTISEEMINVFATVKEFNNVIGHPVNRYRQEYKSLGKLRQMFFDKVENTPDIEKYVEFYKWFDSSINRMMQQLIPASTWQISGVGDTIESHVFERNKYWNKFPTLENKFPTIQGQLLGINEQLYDFDCGFAPVVKDENVNPLWWQDRAPRTDVDLSSGDSGVDSNKEQIRKVLTTKITASAPLLVDNSGNTYYGSTYVVRNLSRPYNFDLTRRKLIHGGPNSDDNQHRWDFITPFVRSAFDSTDYLKIPTDIPDSASYADCTPDIDEKRRLNFTAIRYENNQEVNYQRGKGDLFAPFTIFSSSARAGYKTDSTPIGTESPLDINDLHHDVYGDDYEVPMQSPFTQQHVGGLQRRHVDINFGVSDQPKGYVDIQHRSVLTDNDDSENVLMTAGDQTAYTFGDGTDDEPFSIAMWYKNINDSQSGLLVSKFDDNSLGEYKVLLDADGKITFSLFDYVSGVDIPSIKTDNAVAEISDGWVHIVMTYSGVGGGSAHAGMKIYINGAVTATTATANADYDAMNDQAGEFIFGAEDPVGGTVPKNELGGYYGECSIYGVELTATEVSSLYNSGNWVDQGALTRPPLSWWRMGSNIAGSSPNYTIVDEMGLHNLTMKNFDGTADGITTESPFAATDDGTATGAPFIEGRPEGFILENDSSNLYVKSPLQSYDASTRAVFYRDETAKRPVNIRNIQTTGTVKYLPNLGKGNNLAISPTKAGNYLQPYEVMNFVGRDVNNFYLKSLFDQAGSISNGVAQLPFWFRHLEQISTAISGVVDHNVFGRSGSLDANGNLRRNRLVFAERFSAPGGPESLSRGYLDDTSETYSVYNTMNYRNQNVREALDVLWTIHSDQFGTASIPTASADTNATPSYHKVFGNSMQRLELSTDTADPSDALYSGVGITASHDNKWISHHIPRSDYQYSWITSSVNRTVRNAGVETARALIERITGHSPASGYISGSFESGWNTISGTSHFVPAITFMSAGKGPGLRLGYDTHNGHRVSRYAAESKHSLQTGDWMWHPFVSLNMLKAESFVTGTTFTETTIDGTVHTYNFKNFKGYEQNNNILDYPGYTTFVSLRPSYFNTTVFSEPTNELGEFIFDPYIVAYSSIPGHDYTIGGGGGLPTTPYGARGGGILFNGLMHERNGPYGWCTWKQIRGEQQPLAKHFRKNNIISLITKEPFIDLEARAQRGEGLKPWIRDGDRQVDHVTEPPVTSRYKPFNQYLDVSEEFAGMPGGSSKETTKLRYTHGNNQSSFASVKLNNLLNTWNNSTQLYHDMRKYYYFVGEVPNDANPVDAMLKLDYSEVLFPREKYIYLNETRTRTQFNVDFWKDHRVSNYKRLQNQPSWVNTTFAGPIILSYEERSPGRTQYNYSGSAAYTAASQSSIDNSLFHQTNSLGAVVTLQSGSHGFTPVANGSIWPLDARVEFERADSLGYPMFLTSSFGSKLSSSAGVITMYTIAQKISGGMSGLDGAGELQNDYSLFHNNDLIQSGTGLGIDENEHYTHLRGTNGQSAGLRAGCLYNRRVVEEIKLGGATGHGSKIISGDVLWQAGAQMDMENVIDRFGHKKCTGPFYGTYKEWSEDVKTVGQGYGLLPEYRMSDHIGYYTKLNKLPSKIEDEPANWLSLTGAKIPDISFRNQTVLSEDFVDSYSTTDFLKYFKVLEEDHLGTHHPSRISLCCKAIKKFLPYDGFYPASRTLQMATLFSQSYGSDLTYSSSLGHFRTAVTPFFAPGILYNTIKSGIAVDYPIMTTNALLITGSSTHGTADKGIPRIEKVSGSALYGVSTQREAFNFDYRVPFEALYQPAYFLGKENGILDTEPHPAAALPPINGGTTLADYGDAQLDSRVSFEKCNDLARPEYQLAMNNFLSAIPYFFLKDSKLKSFISKPANLWDQFDSKSVYRMYVVLSKGSIVNADIVAKASTKGEGFNPYEVGAFIDGDQDVTYQKGPGGTKSVQTELPFQALESETGPLAPGLYGKTIRMYDRFGPERMEVTNPSPTQDAIHDGKYDFYGSSFGPPIAISSSYSGSAWGVSTSASFAPYTPPYYHGQAVAVIDYFPPGIGEQVDVYTVPEIFNDPHLRITYLRECEAPFMTHEWGNNIWELTLGDANRSMAVRNAMQISSSVNLLGQVLNYKKAIYDQLGNIEGYEEAENPKDVTSWVIETKFECPVLHFDKENDSNITLPQFGSGSIAAGLWHQYSSDEGSRALSAEELQEGLSLAAFEAKQRQISLSIIGGDAYTPPNTPLNEKSEKGVDLSYLPETLHNAKYVNPHTGEKVTHMRDLAAHIGMGKNKALTPAEVQTLTDIFAQVTKYKTATGPNSIAQQAALSGISDEYFSGNDMLALQYANKQLKHYLDLAETKIEDVTRVGQQGDWKHKIGEFAEKSIVREAVLAIPFTTSETGAMKRYTFPQQWVEYALTGDTDALPGDEGVSPEEGGKIIPSQVVVDQVRALNRYVIPPHLDFINNNVTPCVMYVFEFEHNLDKTDLMNIWQNLPPKSLMDVGDPHETVSSIDHPLFINDFFGVSHGAQTYNFPKTDLRWQIFKVKQRSPNFYPDMTLDQTDNLLPDVNIIDDVDSQTARGLGLNPQVKGRSYKPVKAGLGGIPSYGFNWPYDYFTMLELVRFEAGISLTPGNRPSMYIAEPDRDITPDFGVPAIPRDPVPEKPPEEVRDPTRFDRRNTGETTTVSIDANGEATISKEAPPRGLRNEVFNDPLGDPIRNDMARERNQRSSAGNRSQTAKKLAGLRPPDVGGREGQRKQDLEMFDAYGRDESGRKPSDNAGRDGTSGIDKEGSLSKSSHGQTDVEALSAENNSKLPGGEEGHAVALAGLPGVEDPDVA